MNPYRFVSTGSWSQASLPRSFTEQENRTIDLHFPGIEPASGLRRSGIILEIERIFHLLDGRLGRGTSRACHARFQRGFDHEKPAPYPFAEQIPVRFGWPTLSFREGFSLEATRREKRQAHCGKCGETAQCLEKAPAEKNQPSSWPSLSPHVLLNIGLLTAWLV